MSGLSKLVFVTLFGSLAATAVLVQMRQDNAAAQGKSVVAMAQPATAAQPSGGNTAMLYADQRGHFFADVYVRGIPVRTMVDTGASVVSFSAEDAAKIGLREEAGQRKAQFHTANGIVTASMVRVPEMRLQGITVFDVEAAILPRGAMQGTLLGMSFMRKLQSYESRGTSMVLRR
jgi:aspartyl protease family protein